MHAWALSTYCSREVVIIPRAAIPSQGKPVRLSPHSAVSVSDPYILTRIIYTLPYLLAIYPPVYGSRRVYRVAPNFLAAKFNDYLYWVWQCSITKKLIRAGYIFYRVAMRVRSYTRGNRFMPAIVEPTAHERLLNFKLVIDQASFTTSYILKSRIQISRTKII